MNINQLVAAVNAARAREDFIYFKSQDFQTGVPPKDRIRFLFDGRLFETEVPYRIRFTKGVVLNELNNGCYLVEEDSLKRVIFKLGNLDEVIWTL